MLNNLYLLLIKDQTKELCLNSVKKNGFALEYAKEQNEEICLEVIKYIKQSFELIKLYINYINYKYFNDIY